MAPLETAAELVRRVGAVPPETAVRLLVEACEALEAAGPWCAVTVESLRVSEDPAVHAEVQPAPFNTTPDNAARAQVRAVAAVGYELLRGMPPPKDSDASAWVGVRDELAAVLAPALGGAGAADVGALAHQLRTLARPATAAYAPRLADTVVPARPSQPTPEDKYLGVVLGTWELTKRLGAGGMGDVYKARHVRLGREAAVKLLKPEYAADAEIVHRFFEEAKVVNEINHPHIVEVHDFVEEPGRVYCVMELLQGESLADAVHRTGPLEPRRAAAVFSQVCDALHAAHQRGVVHRDIKPDNIFLSRDANGDDFARVLDFGVARRLSGDGKTQQGAVLGTLYFMAPEQAAGRPVDARADLYAVGVSMVEALTGHPPQVALAERLPMTLPGGAPFPPQLLALVRRCLALDPDARPRTAAEVRDALEALAVPGDERPTTAALEAAAGVGAPASRRRWLAGLFVGVAAATAAGLILFTQSGGKQPAPVKTDLPPPVRTTKLPDVAPPPPKVEPKPPDVAPAPTPVEPKPAPVAVKKPKKGKRPPVEKVEPPAPDPMAARVATLRRRYDALVQRFGKSQLTTLELAVIGQALDDSRAGRDADLAASIVSAEAALDAANNRLNR